MLVIVLYHLHYHYYSWIATEFKLGVSNFINGMYSMCIYVLFYFVSFHCNVIWLTYLFTPASYRYHQLIVHGHNQEKCIQEGKIFCTYSHTMRPEGASNEAINTSSIEAIMKQQWYIKFAITVNQELDVIIKTREF